MNSDIKKVLQELGLSRNAAKTYLALLSMEVVSVRKVASTTGINRGTTHEAIRELVSFGLVSAHKKGEREYYAAESPEKIYELIKDKRKELIEHMETAKDVVPKLLAQNVRPEGKPLVSYFEDDEGVVAILKDVLQTCRNLPDPYYVAYSSKPIRQYLYRKFPKFTERRVNDAIHVKVIAIGDGGDKEENSERKWLPESYDGAISSYTIIYGPKIAHISLANDYTPYGVVIEDCGAATMQRLVFKKLWEHI